MYSVVLSDILGDPLDMIASGPACPDSSTCAQAAAIAEKYRLTLSPAAAALLRQETPKTLPNVTTKITGSVRELCRAAADACRAEGYEPVLLTDCLCCEAREAGNLLGSIARTHAGQGRKRAFIAGGETVVHLTGHGLGGRNQELALAAAPALAGLRGCCVFSVGSDGTDGPTDAAGGYADGYDVRIAKIIADQLGMELEIVKTEWDGLTPALLSGNIDVIIAGMSPTAERRMTIDFTDSYYDTELTVVVRKDSAFAGAKSLADLAGAKITGQMSTFHYDMIDQIEGAVKMPAMETFPTMIVAVSSGAIDGYVADRPGAVSATSANADLTYITFDEGQGFTVSPDDAQIAVGVKQGSPLKAQINEILAGISAEERNAIMDAVVLDQPLSE